VIVGIGSACLIYLLWQILIFTSLDPKELATCLREGKSIIYALQKNSTNRLLAPVIAGFSFCAISTSLLGVALSLIDFIRDGFSLIGRRCSRFKAIVLACFLPITLCFFDPAIFYKALGWAGGFGESYLNGVLPILLLYAYKKYAQPKEKIWQSKSLLFFLLTTAFAVMAIELYHSFFL
jgi:tyrosine-specific transport protein